MKLAINGNGLSATTRSITATYAPKNTSLNANAAIITLVKNVVSTYVERWNTLLGVIFVVVIVFMPYGLVPGCTQAWRRLQNRIKARKAAGGAASEPAQ